LQQPGHLIGSSSPTARELLEKLALPIPNEHTERYAAKAKEHGIWIQTGTFLES
jgi:hypothetical protein